MKAHCNFCGADGILEERDTGAILWEGAPTMRNVALQAKKAYKKKNGVEPEYVIVGRAE